MAKSLVIKTQLGMYDYLAMVNEIASEYFDETGEYQPHIGMLNVIRLFYNFCVESSKWDKDTPHAITDPDELLPLVEDATFMQKFNESIATPEVFAFDFANAYKMAKDMVDARKGSFDNAIDKLRIFGEDIMEKITPMLSDSSMDKLSAIVSGFTSNGLDADSILDSYAHSQAFENVLNGVTPDDNVIPFDKK